MKQPRFIEKLNFQTPISFGLLLSFVGLYFGSLLGHVWILFLGLGAGLLLCLSSQLIYARFHDSLRDADRSCVGLMAIGFGLTALSLICFTVRNLWLRSFSRALIATGVFAVVFVALTVFELLYGKRMAASRLSDGRKGGILRRHLPILLLLIAVLLLSLDTFDSWFRWDSYDYFYYFSNLDYSTLDFFDNLRPANHAAYGASVIFLIVDGIIGMPSISLLLINTLMLLLGTLAFYRILILRFPHWNGFACAICASLFAFSPFLLGLQWSVGLETYLIFGLILFLWAEAEGLPLVQTAAALLICFSKETGALVLCAMVGARLLLHLTRKDRRGEPLLSKLELGMSLPILTVGIFWLFDFLSNSWTSSNNMGMATDGQTVAFNSFSLNFVYIKDRLISLVFTNLTWLILLVVIVGLTVGVVRKKLRESEERFYLLVEVLAGVVGSLIPLLLFVTYNHIRYAGPTVILLLPLLAIAMDCLFRGIRGRSVVCGALSLWLLIQSFWTVDPMMYLFFDRLDKGTGYVALTENSLLTNNATEKAISVRAQYNRELMYFDEALDDLLEKIEYDDRTLLVISNNIKEPSVGSFVYTEYLITGFGYPHMKKPRYTAWDQERGTRYLTEDPAQQMHFLFASTRVRITATMRHYDRCVYLALPFLSEAENERVMNGFYTQEIGETNFGGWHLVAYELTQGSGAALS